MICPKCNSEIRDDSKFCSKCGAKCNNVESSNVKHNNEHKQDLTNGKRHCRICNAEIVNGTLCHKCLNTTNQELLTVDERKQKNDNIEKIGCAFACLGIAIFIAAIILSLFEVINFAHCLIGVGIGFLFFLPLLITSGKSCSSCQRRNTLQKIDTELVGTRNTYIKETRKIEHTRKNGKNYYSSEADYDTYEVDVPATEYHYDVTYKCNKCGNIEVRRKTKIRKD